MGFKGCEINLWVYGMKNKKKIRSTRTSFLNSFNAEYPTGQCQLDKRRKKEKKPKILGIQSRSLVADSISLAGIGEATSTA